MAAFYIPQYGFVKVSVCHYHVYLIHFVCRIVISQWKILIVCFPQGSAVIKREILAGRNLHPIGGI